MLLISFICEVVDSVESIINVRANILTKPTNKIFQKDTCNVQTFTFSVQVTASNMTRVVCFTIQLFFNHELAISFRSFSSIFSPTKLSNVHGVTRLPY